ncbi:EEF1A lysine methyltransferase 2 [Vigna unguiculata]|uniref:Protein-lysine N-methyltransferase DEO72_LG10g4160 n=1 Tax=Vigna unguiculata TaxID=3917 RepID=A0A4D6NJW4_VIGUN|nr:EEF1A lysine methyltransferase 2 [Vigna unguiculata]QCE12909.1 S-adenosyl-L-methionine-dependent methyltransferase [Vigna unguiculata]
MAGIRLQPEDSDVSQQSRAVAVAASDLVSDDDRSVAADSWSIKSEYGSTLDDDQRHADAAEALSNANLRPNSDYSSDKDEPDSEAVSSMLGFQSYWDAAYADELTNFREHGHTGEVWFGVDVMEVVASWTKALCVEISQGRIPNDVDAVKAEASELDDKLLSSWSVLDIGTGNGLLLQELAKQGFSDLTGTDYSERAVNLAQSLADRDGFSNIKFLVDDVLETKLEQEFQLVMDKGTLDAIGLHPDGPVKRMMYWDSVSKLVAPGGILVITSCNSTKDELIQEVESFNQRKISTAQEIEASKDEESCREPPFQYVSHVRTYPTFMFGGSVGSRVATVAFLRK